MRYLFSRASITLYTLIIVIISITPTPPIPGALDFPNLDKLTHFFLYATFSFITINTYLRLRIKRPYSNCIAYVITIGFLIECIQYFLPYRSFEVADIATNCAGTLVGLPLRIRI